MPINEIITAFSMTEVFTPPAACATSWTYEPQGANNVDGGLMLQNAATFVSSCFPSRFDHVGRIEGSQIFSPGYCPLGYTSADVVVDREVTTAICCLSDFDYYTSIQTYGDGGSDIFAGCTSVYPKGNSTIIPVRQETTSTQVVGPVTMWAQPITVALESSDSSLFVPPTTSSTASIASETATSTTATAGPERTPSANEVDSDSATESSQPESEEASSGGLSTGAGVGIGVGVGVGGLAVFAAVGLWLWRLRKAKKRAAGLAMDSTTVYNGHGPPYYPESTPPHSWPKAVSEIDGGSSAGRHRGSPQELYG